MSQPPAQPEGRMHETLRRVFGFDAFRPNQEDIVRAVLGGRDVFAVMPTGGGKSLCYQLPASLLPGVCVVVSPLISLMKDQVDAACDNGMRAAYWNSSLSAAERSDVARRLRAGELDLLYVSPERFGLGGFVDLLKTVPMCLLAIDEAHCISEWGHDFRPDYLQLAELVKRFPAVPLAAFTATATHRVQKDIVERLGLRRPHMVRASFDRPNLFYQIEPKGDATRQIADFLRGRKGQSAIVYRTTRDSVKETADALRERGISALPYHAGMDAKARQQNQNAFSRDEVDVVVATIAFGMGIDKSNVRYVIHGDLPKNIEGYYQETGRAGRDGAPAQCLLLFDMADVRTLRFFVNKIENETERQAASQKLAQMIDLAQSNSCRRRQVLKYFGEHYAADNCGACDFCCGPIRLDDGSVDAQKIMSAVARTDGRLEGKALIDVVTGTESALLRSLDFLTIKTFGVGKDQSPEHWQRIIDELLRQGHLAVGADGARPALTPKGKEVLFGRQTFHFVRPVEVEKAAGRTKAAAAVAADGGEDPVLFEKLRKLRLRLARAQNLPPFVVMSDRTLLEIARRKPRTRAALAGITGIGEAKLRRYGADFLEEVNIHCAVRDAAKGEGGPISQATFRRRHKKGSGEASIRKTRKLLEEGHGVEAVLATRGVARSTAIKHMEMAILAGVKVNIDAVVSPAQQEELADLFTRLGGGELGKVVEAGNGTCTYEQARLVRAVMVAKGTLRWATKVTET